MSEDFTQAADKRALPRPMAEMAALIAGGCTFFGYDLKRDGLPEVVVRAYARVGPEGVRAIVRLAFDTKPVPQFEAAAALTEWGIEHYAGRATALKSDGFQPEWVACGRLLRAHVMRTWGSQIAAIDGAPEDWADWIDWVRAAADNAAAGKVTFVEHEDKFTGEIEVDMFEGTWKKEE